MAFPLLAFIGGAAVGAAAALLLKDRLDRRDLEAGFEHAAEAVDAVRDRVVTATEEVADTVSESAEAAAEAVRDVMDDLEGRPHA
jgi:gas vesicle protein